MLGQLPRKEAWCVGRWGSDQSGGVGGYAAVEAVAMEGWGAGDQEAAKWNSLTEQ